MNDSDQKLLQFLVNIVPRQISDVSNKMQQELVGIRKKLIRKARIITEFRYFLRIFFYDSKTEQKVKKFEADYFNSPYFNPSEPPESGRKVLRKSISIDQNFLNSLLNNEETGNIVPPQTIKKTKNSRGKDNYSDSECFDSEHDSDFVTYLFNPKEVTPFLGLSLVSQNSSVILNHIHENPSILIEGLLKNQDHQFYVHITQKIIPSIFGYFASTEHLDLASFFYTTLIATPNVTPDMAIPILSPFFNSPATYRFTEKLYSEFFKNIVYEDSDDNEFKKHYKPPHKPAMMTSQSMEFNNAQTIKESSDPRVQNSRILNICILNAAPLLPPQFYRIFKQMRIQKWTLKDWYNIFFREFILISMNQWIRASFCDEYVEILFNIMSRKFTTKKELAILFKGLLKLSPIYEPPEIFNCFKSLSTLYMLNIRDMQILVKFLDDNKILPPSVDISSFNRVPKKFRYLSFWCNVYSKKRRNSIPFLPELKESNDNRLVFQSFSTIRKRIENDEYKSETNKFKKEFQALQTLAEKNDQTNSIEFMLRNTGKGEFHTFAQKRCYLALMNDADNFEEMMELLRFKDIVSGWRNLLQSNENMLVLSHISIFEKRMDVVQSMPIFIKQAIFLNKIDESRFKKYSEKFAEIGTDWDIIIHSPHFLAFKFSNSLSYAPSPTLKKSKKTNGSISSSSSSAKVEKNININNHGKKLVNSASSPDLSKLANDDEESPNISEVSSDTEHNLLPKRDLVQNNLNINRSSNKKQITISVNCPTSEKGSSNESYNNNNVEVHVTRSMSSEELYAQSKGEVQPLASFKQLPNTFFETLELVSLIHHVRLPEKFLIMLKTMEHIDFLSNNQNTDFSLYYLLLQNIPGQIILPIYVELNVFAMREPSIFLLCTETERKRWLRFEQIILKCASENLDFLAKLINLQSALQDEFNQWKSKNLKAVS